MDTSKISKEWRDMIERGIIHRRSLIRRAPACASLLLSRMAGPGRKLFEIPQKPVYYISSSSTMTARGQYNLGSVVASCVRAGDENGGTPANWEYLVFTASEILFQSM